MATRTLAAKPPAPKLVSRRLQKFGVHPADPDAVTLDMRRLCIATNHGVLDIGVATGVFASEGKRHRARDFFTNHYVADGNLITGQNQNAGRMVPRMMMQRVLANRAAAQPVVS